MCHKEVTKLDRKREEETSKKEEDGRKGRRDGGS